MIDFHLLELSKNTN